MSAVAYESFRLQSLRTIQTGFHNNGHTVTRAGRLREWSQGELRLKFTVPHYSVEPVFSTHSQGNGEWLCEHLIQVSQNTRLAQ